MTRSAASPWSYRNGAADGIVEIGEVVGRDVALPAQFHDEDQLTFVVAGQRRFLIRGERIVVTAGTAILIRARVVHSSLNEPDGVACLNAYAPAGTYADDAVTEAAARCWREAGRLDAGDLAAILFSHRLGPAASPPARPAHRERVAATALRHGMTREGFSRAFVRRHGMAPHAFALAARLNTARALLRSGVPIADVAAAVGFVDQSHLGRHFRRAFGIAPGAYRIGWSQTYQTAR